MAERKAETCTDCIYHGECVSGKRRKCVLNSEEAEKVRKEISQALRGF